MAPLKSRFGPPVESEDMDRLIQNCIPGNTKKTTTWCMNIWRAWCDFRQITDNIEALEAEQLNDHLCNFIMEVNKQDGSCYPPNTLYQIVASIQRHLKENGRPEMSILDPKSLKFVKVRQVLDARMKLLTSQGTGATIKQAEPLTKEQVDTLCIWQKEIFGVNTADAILNTIFWYNCKCFGLHESDEHRNLDVEQFSVDSDENGQYLRFIGRSSKNFQGGIEHRKIHNKDLRIYSKPELGDRCVVSLFLLYLSLIPESGPFYRQPIKNSNPPKFSKQVVGRNILSTVVKRFCEAAGFSGNYTNHSGKVTCATALFHSGIDEQLVQRQTRHRSDAVRRYKQPSKEQDTIMSSILQPPPEKSHVMTLTIKLQNFCYVKVSHRTKRTCFKVTSQKE